MLKNGVNLCSQTRSTIYSLVNPSEYRVFDFCLPDVHRIGAPCHMNKSITGTYLWFKHIKCYIAICQHYCTLTFHFINHRAFQPPPPSSPPPRPPSSNIRTSPHSTNSSQSNRTSAVFCLFYLFVHILDIIVEVKFQGKASHMHTHIYPTTTTAYLPPCLQLQSTESSSPPFLSMFGTSYTFVVFLEH